VFDMPGDGLRYVRDSVGVDTVVVNGQVAWAKGAYSGSKSGAICGLN
jgi:N-acyl-D-amino-acid deacylase